MDKQVDKSTCQMECFLVYSRRSYIYFVAFLAVFGLCCAKQNVLFLVADDLRPTLGCYGDTRVISPNIDQLASHSVQFNQAYVQQAVCGPSRASFLTSRRPDTTHVIDQTHYWRIFGGNYTTLPQHFKHNGYYTKSVGKIFHPGKASGKNDDFPYSWSEPAYHPPTQSYKMSKVCPGPDGNLHMDLICPVDIHTQPGGSLPDIQSTQYAIQFLRNYSSGGVGKDKPLFLAVGLHKPHVPFKYPRQYQDLYPLSRLSLPLHPDFPQEIPYVSYDPWTDIREREDVAQLNAPFPFGPLPKDFQLKIIQNYLASVTYMDDQIGLLLNELDSLGLSNNTVISFIGDHGWQLGENGGWAKYSNTRVTTRIPMLVYSPGVTAIHDGNLFQHIDPFLRSFSYNKDSKSHVFNLQNIGAQSNVRVNNNTGDGRSRLENDPPGSFALPEGQMKRTYSTNIGNIQTNGLVEAVDLFPTLSDLVGITVPSQCTGDSTKIRLCTEGLSFVPLIKRTVLDTDIGKHRKDRNIDNERIGEDSINDGRITYDHLSSPIWKKAVFTQYPRPSLFPQNNSDSPDFRDIKIMGYSVQTEQYRYTEWVSYNSTCFCGDWSHVYANEFYLHTIDAFERVNRVFDKEYDALVSEAVDILHKGWKYALPNPQYATR